MSQAQVLETVRIGQLTGTTDRDAPVSKWPLLVDVQGWPLLTDTGRWGAVGVDLGATTEHDGRIYFFFGDVATKDLIGIPRNADLVAWTDATQVLRHGGHLALGLNFTLPYEPTVVPGQIDWRFCGKCGGLFWDGDLGFKGVCIRGGAHEAIGWKFVIPYEPTVVPGQPDWRFCGKCSGLFWDGDPGFKGACPGGGAHEAIGWKFVLPHDQNPPLEPPGQIDWRFCGKCSGLHWDGGVHKGLCPGAPGGGFQLHGVLRDDGLFDPFTGTDPVGQTLTFEVPNGAFSYTKKVWVFGGISDVRWSGQRRPGDPALGCYLLSKERPDLPGVYQTEFLFSPRIGWCPRDAQRDRLESHVPLGMKFILSHDIAEDPSHQGNYRFCAKCTTLVWDGDPVFKGHCHRGGSHEVAGFDYVLPHSMAEDVQHQANWRRCAKCHSVFWDGDLQNSGLCPAEGTHQATEFNLLLTHPSLEEDATHQADWRFCEKCGAMFWDGDRDFTGRCPKDGAGHVALGYNFLLPHDVQEDALNQKDWRFCGKCGALFWDGYAEKGTCPKDGAGHSAIGLNFVLPHDIAEETEKQGNWRYCGKCFALFWDGDLNFKGHCPQDGSGHAAIGFNFVLPHNPGEDKISQGGWRFCVKCHGAVWTRQEDLFPWVAPWVVRNADHPGLPETPHEQGLVMFGFGPSSKPGIRLAWMPLKQPVEPMLQDILYYTGDGQHPWSPNVDDAVIVLPHSEHYTHLSLAWLEGPQRWILLYSNAHDDLEDPESFHQPVVARLGTSLWEWTDELEIFDPEPQGAYGVYMHKIGLDSFNVDIPPPQDPALPEHDGWAYGPFIVNRFTEWNAATRELGIYYLLSLSTPYQVQLMYTRLHLD